MIPCRIIKDFWSKNPIPEYYVVPEFELQMLLDFSELDSMFGYKTLSDKLELYKHPIMEIHIDFLIRNTNNKISLPLGISVASHVQTISTKIGVDDMLGMSNYSGEIGMAGAAGVILFNVGIKNIMVFAVTYMTTCLYCHWMYIAKQQISYHLDEGISSVNLDTGISVFKLKEGIYSFSLDKMQTIAAAANMDLSKLSYKIFDNLVLQVSINPFHNTMGEFTRMNENNNLIKLLSTVDEKIKNDMSDRLTYAGIPNFITFDAKSLCIAIIKIRDMRHGEIILNRIEFNITPGKQNNFDKTQVLSNLEEYLINVSEDDGIVNKIISLMLHQENPTSIELHDIASTPSENVWSNIANSAVIVILSFLADLNSDKLKKIISNMGVKLYEYMPNRSLYDDMNRVTNTITNKKNVYIVTAVLGTLVNSYIPIISELLPDMSNYLIPKSNHLVCALIGATVAILTGTARIHNIYNSTGYRSYPQAVVTKIIYNLLDGYYILTTASLSFRYLDAVYNEQLLKDHNKPLMHDLIVLLVKFTILDFVKYEFANTLKGNLVKDEKHIYAIVYDTLKSCIFGNTISGKNSNSDYIMIYDSIEGIIIDSSRTSIFSKLVMDTFRSYLTIGCVFLAKWARILPIPGKNEIGFGVALSELVQNISERYKVTNDDNASQIMRRMLDMNSGPVYIENKDELAELFDNLLINIPDSETNPNLPDIVMALKVNFETNGTNSMAKSEILRNEPDLQKLRFINLETCDCSARTKSLIRFILLHHNNENWFQSISRLTGLFKICIVQETLENQGTIVSSSIRDTFLKKFSLLYKLCITENGLDNDFNLDDTLYQNTVPKEKLLKSRRDRSLSPTRIKK